MPTDKFDVAIIGAGAAGMFCAGVAGQRGLRVVLIDHASKIGEKIRISGGGRCNFTNVGTTPAQFVSQNPHFCRSALARYTPQDFIKLVQQNRIPFHEKNRGQLFCDESAQDIIDLLIEQCHAGNVIWRTPCAVQQVEHAATRDYAYTLHTSQGTINAKKLVVATGGLSIPKIGATGFGYELAQQFGHTLIATRPSLVPLTFSNEEHALFSPLAGVSLDVRLGVLASPSTSKSGKQRAKAASFDEDILFTHRGLSGPAVLQITNYLEPGQSLVLNLMPQADSAQDLLTQWQAARTDRTVNRKQAAHLLSTLPARLAQEMVPRVFGAKAQTNIADLSNADLQNAANAIAHWVIKPSGSEGYKKAEVTLGGVDTRELSSSTMQSERVPGLYFIGEVLDVTGWLGGYNFQWAWASGYACGMAL